MKWIQTTVRNIGSRFFFSQVIILEFSVAVITVISGTTSVVVFYDCTTMEQEYGTVFGFICLSVSLNVLPLISGL